MLEHVRDLGRAEAEHVAQDEHRALRGRQVLEARRRTPARPPRASRSVPPGRRGAAAATAASPTRVGSGGSVRQLDLVRPARGVAQRVQAAVGRDPVQPGAQRGAALEAVEPAPGGQQRLLHDVLGVLDASRASGSSGPRARGGSGSVTARKAARPGRGRAYMCSYGHRRRAETHRPIRARTRCLPAHERDSRWVLVLAVVAASDGRARHARRVDRAEHDPASTSTPRSPQLEWTVNAYNLSFAVLLMTGAALGDRFGRRRAVRRRAGALRRSARRPARWRLTSAR